MIRSISSWLFSHLPIQGMALEVQYVNCQGLHNPSFTPRVFSSQSNVSPGCECQQLKAPAAPDIEHVSSSVNLLALKEVLPDPGTHLEILQGEESDIFPEGQHPQLQTSSGHNVDSTVSLVIPALPLEAGPSPSCQTDKVSGSYGIAIPPVSPSILIPPTKLLKAHASSQELGSEMHSVVSESCGRDVNSTHDVEEEHEAAARAPIESNSMHDEPSTSDQDDDVQFILSVARKKKKKRIRQDLLQGNPDKDASIEVSKNAAKKISNDAGQNIHLGPKTAGSKFTAALSLPGPNPGMHNCEEQWSIRSTAPGSLLTTDPSSTASIPKTRNKTTRKRKRNQDSSLTVTPQTFGSANGNSGLISMQTPILHRYLQSPQRVYPSAQFSGLQHLPGSQSASKGQSLSEFGNYSPPHGPGPLSEQTRTNFVQTHMPSLVGPVTSTIQESLASTSVSDSLRRRPSLYAIPQWQVCVPGSGMATQTLPKNASRSIYHNPYVPSDVTWPGMFSVASHAAGAGNLPSVNVTPSGHFADSSASQVRNLECQNGLSKQSHSPNMLVDIAQTCQDNFPFALIAKRHNKSIQKVFDTFSAVIQLPLLRSAVDARRPGKLGSLRMKEFRAMKKAAGKISKGKQTGKKGRRKAEENGIAGN